MVVSSALKSGVSSRLRAISMKRPSKHVVGHVTDCYFKLSENWIHTQLEHLQDWEPVVLTQDVNNLETVSWRPRCIPRWHHLPKPIGKIDASLGEWLQFSPVHCVAARWYGVRALHAHFGPVGCDALHLARRLGVPLVTTFYGYDLSRLPNEEPKWVTHYKDLFAAGTCFLVEGPRMAQQLETLGCPSEKIRVHPLGIPVDNYPYRNRMSNDREDLRVLMAGRFVEKKGFPDAVEAFAAFIHRGGSGTLTIVGDNPRSGDGEDIKAQLQALVASHGLEDTVTFTGFLPHSELQRQYYEHDIFLSPSRTAADGDNEGGAPVSIIEAQATGMPVVSTWHCDIPSVVNHETTGLLTPEGDVSSLADALMTLQRNPARIRTMGKAAHERIRVQYDAHAQAMKLEALYESLLESNQ